MSMPDPITNHRAWIHYHNRRRDSEGDMAYKFYLIKIIREEMNLHALTGEYLIFDKRTEERVYLLPQNIGTKQEFWEKYIIHLPDLFIKNHRPQIVIEIDGPVHWMTQKGINQTNSRNEHYEWDSENLKFIWLLNQDLALPEVELRRLVRGKFNEIGIKPFVKTLSHQ